MDRKKSFVTGIVLTALTVLVIVLFGLSAYNIANTEFEGWDGLGAAIALLLNLIVAAVITDILTPISIACFNRARRSITLSIVKTSVAFMIINIVFAVASYAFTVYMIINGILS